MTKVFFPLAFPVPLRIEAVTDKIRLAQAQLAFGHVATNPREIDDLYLRSFPHELSTAVELRMVPPGWLEQHQILLPDTIELNSVDAIQTRLERMVNTVRDTRAINAILCRIALTGIKDTINKFFNPISSLKRVACILNEARETDAHFVDSLLRGYLGESLKILKERTISIPIATAHGLLVNLSILWGLHDLQIIVCRLFQATMWPTAGWAEGRKCKPQTFANLFAKANSLNEYFNTIEYEFGNNDLSKLKHNNGIHHKSRMQSLIGYAHANKLFEPATKYASELGFFDSENHHDLQKLPDDLRLYFIESSQKGITLIELINRIAERKCQGRYSETKVSASERLHASSFRDGMRPEVALSYAIFTFVYAINALPKKLFFFVYNKDSSSFDDENLHTPSFRQLKPHIANLIEAYRSIYLIDANLLRQEGQPETFLTNLTRNNPSHFEMKQIFMENQTLHLIEDPYFRHGDLLRPSGTTNTAKAMIRDAREVLKREKALSGMSLNVFNENAVDPKLSIALRWRFSCFRQNVPPPVLTRPFTRQF